jgi:hypothetical protein
MCNCNNNNPCIPNQTLCAPQVDCTCPVRLNSECVTYNGLNLECSGIESGLPLNQTIQLLDAYICEAIEEINTSINLINVGEGEDIYAGIDGIGRRKIKRVNTDSNILTITPNENDITFGIDEEALDIFIEENETQYTCDNIGASPSEPNEVFLYKETYVEPGLKEFRFRSVYNSDGTIELNQLEGTIEINSKSFIEAGDNTNIIGTGTLADPYIINSTDTNTDTIVTLQDGTTTTVNGDGVIVPYSVEIENLQRTINTFPYTLVDTDDKQTIFVENGASNVVINVPDGLVNNFSAVFIQKGTGTVTIQASGTAMLNYPSSVLQNIIKGQYFWAMVEKELTINTYYLLGSLLPV